MHALPGRRESRLHRAGPGAHVPRATSGYAGPVHENCLVLDERHVGDDDLPRGNLMAAIPA